MTSPNYDVIAAEVHRKSMENLTNEMSIALLRTSGSPAVVDAKDFSACFLDTTPEHLGFAAYVLFHLGTSLVGTRHVAQLAEKAGDLRPGDGWIVNDPIVGGAAHQADVAVIMPMFYGPKHMGWGFLNMHLLDIGGYGLSGLAPGAHDIYSEGLRFSGARAIRNGRIDPEWETFIADNVRAPGPVLNDIRSMITAANVGNQKLSQVIEGFGLKKYEEYGRINKDITERVLRERISSLPDGVYESVEWNEFDGHGVDELSEIRLRMEISGSDLHLDFKGAPQSSGFVNTGKGAVLGQVATALLTTLAYGDLPVNGGLWRPLHIDNGEPGTVVNASLPAPVSFGHSEVGMRVCKLTKDVLNQALSMSSDPVLRGRISGKGNDAPCVSAMYGTSQHGTTSVALYLDHPVGLGGPAQTTQDGQDAYGCTSMTGCGLSDIESHENADPLLFLWRSIVPNSGGPGQFRGGQGLQQGYLVAYTNQLGGPSINVCAQVPPSGFAGGFPSGTSSHYIVRGSDVRERMENGELSDADQLGGVTEQLANKSGHLTIAKDDVYVMASGGGSGLGDPLLRDLTLVVADIRAGYITPGHALAAYGVVVVANGELEEAATQAAREKIRSSRIGGTPIRALSAPPNVGIAVTFDKGEWSCASCARQLGGDWRSGATLVENEISKRYEQLEMPVAARTSDPVIMMREHYCPSCAQSLGVDVVAQGTPALPAARLTTARPAGA